MITAILFPQTNFKKNIPLLAATATKQTRGEPDLLQYPPQVQVSITKVDISYLLFRCDSIFGT